MAQPYVGEIRLFAGNFAPAGWMMCNGQLLPISENEVLFQLIGTTYGGDGQETFALPQMQSRVTIHQGNGFTLAETGGAEEVTLTVPQIPQHAHGLLTTDQAGTADVPGPTVMLADHGPAGNTQAPVYAPTAGANLVTLSPASIGPAGGNQPHDNMQPYFCINYIISLFGIFPSQT